ncbi:GAF domain-containing protein [Methanocella sp. MCL-LM]|uniref:GAF domain-containing protein n=1 Tax=Methanocella sp. MCL-LM TaxID=3412035 RepID=UPI003C78D42A
MESLALSDTEHLIVSYVQSHPPEESMLDKISTGTGKSRATVLKYLEALHAKGILDFRIIGRNKLWMVKQAPLPGIVSKSQPAASPGQEQARLLSAARELYGVKVRERELGRVIDQPDTLVAAIDEELNIIFSNNTFQQRFSGAADFGRLLSRPDVTEMRKAVLAACAGDTVSLELNLGESTGIFRAYKLSLSPASADMRGIAAIVIGEDLTDLKRSRRDLESLLYIIRTAGEARDEQQLLKGTLKGIRERLLHYTHAVVYLDGSRIAHKSQNISAETLDSCWSLADQTARSLESISAPAGGGKNTDYLLAVPIIGEEKPVGALVLTLTAPACTTDVENLEIVADEIAGALKSLRLDREKAEYVNTLLAVNRVSAVLNETRDEAGMLERSIASTMATLGFDMGCVYLKECGNEMAMKVHKNMPESLYSMCLSGKFKALFDRALQERRVIHITRDTPEYAELDAEITANGVSTILVLPIVAGDEIVGLLNMGSRSYKPYSRMSLDNIASIGLQLGLALERTRLATALEEQANKDLT